MRKSKLCLKLVFLLGVIIFLLQITPVKKNIVSTVVAKAEESETTNKEDKINISDTVPSFNMKFVGTKKDKYIGEIYNQQGRKITNFITNSSGEYILKKSLIKEEDTEIYVVLISKENLVPVSGVGADFRSPLIPLDKAADRSSILKINLEVVPSTLRGTFKVTFIDKLLGNTTDGFKINLFNRDGKYIGSESADKSGTVVFNNIVPGTYTLKFPDIKYRKFISLTNNNQNFFGESEKLILDRFNGPNWDRGPMYIISVPGAFIGIICIFIIVIPSVYVLLGFKLPRKG